jgi:mevalonate kinase
MTQTDSACGKIIVSGEYAVLFGKKGLAVPAKNRIDVTVSASQKTDGLTMQWRQSDVDAKWVTYAEKIMSLLSGHSPRGELIIESSLPLGKGMGSSTALVIAMARCILGPDCREKALQIEDEVNKGHSGLDFAVIWSEEPTVFKKGDAPVRADLPKDFLAHSHLIDTGAPNETTAELVAWIKGKKDTAAAIEIIGNCTERLLKGENLKTVMRDHHHAQCMLGVVPKSAQKVIAEIEAKGGSAKVIGAGTRTGGGGMVLAID